MMFKRHLRQGIREGRITCTVRIWQKPHVRPGGIYPMEGGHIVVESIRRIALADIDGELARRSGFAGVVDLLKVAKHGPGTNVYLIDFHYVGGADEDARPARQELTPAVRSAAGPGLDGLDLPAHEQHADGDAPQGLRGDQADQRDHGERDQAGRDSDRPGDADGDPEQRDRPGRALLAPHRQRPEQDRGRDRDHPHPPPGIVEGARHTERGDDRIGLLLAGIGVGERDGAEHEARGDGGRDRGEDAGRIGDESGLDERSVHPEPERDSVEAEQEQEIDGHQQTVEPGVEAALGDQVAHHLERRAAAGRMQRHAPQGGDRSGDDDPAMGPVVRLERRSLFLDQRHVRSLPIATAGHYQHNRQRRRTLGREVRKRTRGAGGPERRDAMEQARVQDRRMDRTREALRKAFVGLIGQKRYEDIRVADILDRANVGKSTFYEHFRSKEDLLRSTMDWILRDLADCASQDFDTGRLNGLVGHFWDNRRLGRVVFGVPMVASTRRMLAALIEERLAARESWRRADRNALRLNALQIAAGHLALLHAWLSGEIVAERAAIVAALRELACPGGEERPVPKKRKARAA